MRSLRWRRRAVNLTRGSNAPRGRLFCEALEERNLLSFIVQSPFPSGGPNPAALVAGELFNHNEPDLAVTNNNLGGTNGSVTIYKNTTADPVGDITFAQTQTIPLGREPIGITTGQFTNSGLNDLVIANNGDGDGTIEVLLNDPNNPGTYQAPTSYNVGGKPFAVVVGQFTASGNQDILVGFSDKGSVSLLLGNGDGTFQPPIPIDTGGAGSQDIIATPFTLGGNYNIVVANHDSNNVSVLMGNGDSTFQPPMLYAVGVEPYTLAVGDVNNDGFPDIVVADQDSTNPNGGFVTVLLNDGSNTNFTRTDYPAGFLPTDVLLASFHNDGHLDIAVSNFFPFGGSVNVLLNDGTGAFGPATKYATGGNLATGIAIADFNGDTFPDIVVGNGLSNSLTVLRNDGMQPIPPPGRSADPGPMRAVPVSSAPPTSAIVAPVLPLPGVRQQVADQGNLVLSQRTEARKAELSALFADFEPQDSFLEAWLRPW